MVTPLEGTDPEKPSCKVLLVDDEPSILTVLHWALEDFGCAVSSACGGQAGLDALCKDRFDILITDLIMPDLDGFFLLTIARKLNPDVRIIMMTGSPELVPADVEEEATIDVLLTKPFSLSQVKAALMRCAGEVDREVGFRGSVRERRCLGKEG